MTFWHDAQFKLRKVRPRPLLKLEQKWSWLEHWGWAPLWLIVQVAKLACCFRAGHAELVPMGAYTDSYTNATIILRPARVAVLFRGDDRWRSWARLAIAVAGKYWGGGGFILVPYREDGSVVSRMLDVVAAYDPDHVVTVPLTPHTRERIAPGHDRFTDANGRSLVDPNERQEFLADLVALPQPEPVAMKARKAVAAVCTPLRNAHDPSGEVEGESVEILEFEPSRAGGWLAPAARVAQDGAVLAGSEVWTNDASLSASIRTGIFPYELDQELRAARPEPDGGQALKFALNPERWKREVPAVLTSSMNVGTDALIGNQSFWFDEPGSGLVSMRNRWGSDGGAIVIGGTAEDFALAYAHERLFGYGVWLTSEMLGNEALLPVIRTAADWAGQVINGESKRLSITSCSLNPEELAAAAMSLNKRILNTNPIAAAETGTLSVAMRLPDGLEIREPALRLGLTGLAVHDPFVTSVSVPVEVGQDGTTTMRAPVPTPMPAEPLSVDGRIRPYWYVEVDLSETAMPKSRGVPQSFVVMDRQHYANQAVRSSRIGLTFHSQLGGLIPSGTPLNSQIFKPTLRVLGMQPWIQSMAGKSGLDAVPSLPGRHAQLLARLLGGRNELTSMVAGVFHPALHLFTKPESNKRKDIRPRDVFPDGDGVLIDKELPYPRFDAFRRVLPGISVRGIQAWIDRLAASNLLRRGFILDCSDCSRPSFVSLEKIGQRFECVRCGAANDLSVARWKHCSDELEWHYDLHATFRELLGSHGDVGLIAAERLRRQAWEYADTTELEFLEQRTGKRVAEIDLIANIDGDVVVVEAKSNGRLGNSKREKASTAAKKIQVAEALRADRVLIVTSADKLADDALEILREAADFRRLRSLQIEGLAGLGPDTIDLPDPTPDETHVWQPT
ncbi:hypothetical protein [Arthrobacter sp. MMS18-M83]|uniref:hypothetical protein n=1 Tax=Arthrobacter sp. MMS18-M83 TaxID=2996261 RepID=UPI00227B72EB|nr:hypothetical protein [Arthrobacter sp. MMS18-M83]WAH96291.1 hypothetical protein OW521_17975 [Arthrobacter sp. MMS18-M83]